MGQYYVAIILGPAGEKREFIRCWVDTWHYGSGSKLMEHSYIGNKFVSAVEWLLSPLGPFWKSRLVWAGDYADAKTSVSEEATAVAGADEEGSEADSQDNLYHAVLSDNAPEAGKRETPSPVDMSDYRYIVNHTKQLYVDKKAVNADGHGYRIHPMPLLTAEGNGRGGGDFHGTGEPDVGSWARDVISVEREAPADYEKVHYEFQE